MDDELDRPRRRRGAGGARRGDGRQDADGGGDPGRVRRATRLLFAAGYVALQLDPQRLHRRGAERARRCTAPSCGSSPGYPGRAVWLAGGLLREKRGSPSGSRRSPSTTPRRSSATGRRASAGRHRRTGRSGRALRRAVPAVHHHRARRDDRRHRRHGLRPERPRAANVAALVAVLGTAALLVALLRPDRRSGSSNALAHAATTAAAEPRRLHLPPHPDRRRDHRRRRRRRNGDRPPRLRAARRRPHRDVGGPALYLLGHALFRWRMTRSVSSKRLGAMALLIALAPLAPHVPALATASLILAILTALAALETGAASVPTRQRCARMRLVANVLRHVAHSSRGLGRRPLTPVTRVRIPYALPLRNPRLCRGFRVPGASSRSRTSAAPRTARDGRDCDRIATR